MNRTLLVFSLMVSSFLSATIVDAQSLEEAYVPFAFKAGNTQMPAGKYLIEDTGVNNFVTICDLKTGKSVIVLAPSRVSLPLDTQPSLLFHRLGTEHFLAAIWNNSGLGRSFSANKQEREMREHLVASNRSATSSEVMIAMK